MGLSKFLLWSESSALSADLGTHIWKDVHLLSPVWQPTLSFTLVQYPLSIHVVVEVDEDNPGSFFVARLWGQCAVCPVKLSAPSTMGKKSGRNFIISPPSAPSVTPTSHSFFLLLLFSKSWHLSWIFFHSLMMSCCDFSSVVTLSNISPAGFLSFYIL